MAEPATRVDGYASEPHYLRHVRSVWDGLDATERGNMYVPVALRSHPLAVGARTGSAHGGRNPVIVASANDTSRLRHRPRILIEHGAGQTYRCCPSMSDHPSYAGGHGHDGTILFLCPNEQVAGRWTERYPAVPTAVVGVPALDPYHRATRRENARTAASQPSDVTVAVSFHWDGSHACQELASCQRPFVPHIPDLVAAGYRVLGHGHPRIWNRLRQTWRRMDGVEPVESFEDILDRADLYIVDNSSTAIEFASTGRPILWMHHAQWRRWMRHGGRFWDWEPAGYVCDDPTQLVAGVELAVADAPDVAQSRERIVASVYPWTDGHAGDRAVEAIRTHVIGGDDQWHHSSTSEARVTL